MLIIIMIIMIMMMMIIIIIIAAALPGRWAVSSVWTRRRHTCHFP